MEIVPGEGLPFARLGHTLDDIESLAGPSVTDGDNGAFWQTHSPPFAAWFGRDAKCELIEVYASGGERDRVTLGGVQLVGRPMSEVEGDLRRIGRSGRRTCLTVDFDDGLTLWSLDELASDLAGAGPVVEGVAIAPHPPWTDERLDRAVS